MACETGENITICRPHMDAWSRFFMRCPVCKTRRLCLEEFQDYYGSRCMCLTCGTDWMEGEYRKHGKKESAKHVASAKARIKSYIEAGIPQGYKAFMDRLEAEIAARNNQKTETVNG